jgi:hypothetical protein
MIEVSILIPVAGNDGVVFTEDHHLAFQAFVLGRFGGISRLPGTVVGQWVDEGITYTDSTIVYIVAMKSIADGAKLADVATFAKSHYGQEAIYIRYLNLSEVL